MALRDIMNALHADGSASQVQSIRNDSGKTIIHFESISSVDESKFLGIEDPLVVYRTRGNIETVSVAPLQAGQEAIAALPFSERKNYFKRYQKPLYTAKTGVVEVEADATVVTQISTDYGTFEDFTATFENPTDMDTTIPEFFNGLYLDLKPEALTDFNSGFASGL